MSIQFEIIKLKDKYIESLEELIGKPEIIGKVESIKYINERQFINTNRFGGIITDVR